MDGKRTDNIFLQRVIGVALFIAGVFFVPYRVHAATLFFSPSSGALKVGQTFSVGIYVSSADQAMNATQGIVSFPTDKLSIVSESKGGSMLNLWVQEPGFSNSAGTANFEGIVYNPGFKGNSGKVMSITFKALAAGTATVKFSSGSVLANDGQGTNIVSSLGNAQFTISIPTKESGTPPTTGKPEGDLKASPTAPEVSSPTHPDPDRWYSDNNPTFEWTNSNDIIGVSFSVDHDSATNPDNVSEGQLESYTSPTLKDGEWFFHVKVQNTHGWGEPSHFHFQIDTKNPEFFNITEIEDTPASIAKFIFNAEDALSGIDKYEVRIDNNIIDTWHDDGNHVYTTPALGGGIHTMVVKAFDKAGNFLSNPVDFDVTAGSETPKDWRQLFKLSGQYQGILIIFFIALPSILLCILFILLILNAWHKFIILRRRTKNGDRDMVKMEHEFDQTLTHLHSEIEEFKLMMEKSKLKRKLAEEELNGNESKTLGKIEQDIDTAKKDIKRRDKNDQET